MESAAHSIRVVANRTGLTPHVIRIWEKRYGAVEPQRTATNRRLYAESDIERLSILADLTRHGHSIGAVAGLPLEELQAMATQLPTEPAASGALQKSSETRAKHHLNRTLAAVRQLDESELENSLRAALMEQGNRGFLQKLIGPLAKEIGELWRDGEITAAHEHFATSAIKIFVGNAAKSFLAPESAPNLIVATPAGQLHELGAVIVAATATQIGWRVTYLGASLPATEIAGAARQNKSLAVALSLVYPPDDEALPGELLQLREYLPDQLEILVGGRSADDYRDTLDSIGARVMSSTAELESVLTSLRLSRP